MANKVTGDYSAWLDQIERDRHALMLTIRSGKLSAQQQAIAALIESDIQAFVDRAIDGETRRG